MAQSRDCNERARVRTRTHGGDGVRTLFLIRSHKYGARHIFLRARAYDLTSNFGCRHCQSPAHGREKEIYARRSRLGYTIDACTWHISYLFAVVFYFNIYPSGSQLSSASGPSRQVNCAQKIKRRTTKSHSTIYLHARNRSASAESRCSPASSFESNRRISIQEEDSILSENYRWKFAAETRSFGQFVPRLIENVKCLGICNYIIIQRKNHSRENFCSRCYYNISDNTSRTQKKQTFLLREYLYPWQVNLEMELYSIERK